MVAVRWCGFLTLFVAGAGLNSLLAVQRLPKCEAAKVQYSPFNPSYSNRIVLQSVTDTENAPANAAKQYSPQHTMWLARVQADYSKPGPWTTSVYFGSDASYEVLKLSFIDHGNGGVQVDWLNEKLVFGRVWWGRVYSTDFILDLEKKDFIYREMAHYGELVQPCQ